MTLSNQHKSLQDQRITFTPLSHNRLRCNWNGVIIKQHQRDAVANRRWSELYKPDPNETTYFPVEVQAQTSYRVQLAAISRDGNYVACPYCNTKMWGSQRNPLAPGKMRCNSCRKEFNAIRSDQLPTADWKSMNGSLVYGSAFCPKCNYFNDYHKPGEILCSKCKNPFLAVKVSS